MMVICSTFGLLSELRSVVSVLWEDEKQNSSIDSPAGAASNMNQIVLHSFSFLGRFSTTNRLIFLLDLTRERLFRTSSPHTANLCFHCRLVAGFCRSVGGTATEPVGSAAGQSIAFHITRQRRNVHLFWCWDCDVSVCMCMCAHSFQKDSPKKKWRNRGLAL